MGVIWASHHGFQGCLTSARNAAAVLGGEVFAYEAGAEWPDCDLLVLSSWHGDYVLPEGPRIVMRWHSTLLQTELSGDLPKLTHVLDLGLPLACADRETAEALGATWLPDVLDEAEYAGVEPAALEGVNVVLPGEPYPRKNLVVQVAAFERARAGRDWTLHLLGQTARRPELGAWLARHARPVRRPRLPRPRRVPRASWRARTPASPRRSPRPGATRRATSPRSASPSSSRPRSSPSPSRWRTPRASRRSPPRLQTALEGGAELAARARDGMRARAAANAEVARAALARLADG